MSSQSARRFAKRNTKGSQVNQNKKNGNGNKKKNDFTKTPTRGPNTRRPRFDGRNRQNRGPRPVTLTRTIPPTINISEAEQGKYNRKFDQMLQYSGGGGDARNPFDATPLNVSKVVSDNNNLVSVTVDFDLNAFIGVVSAAMARSYSAGYLEYIMQQGPNFNSYPYFAARYFNDLLVSVVTTTDSIPKFKIPIWIRDLLAALSPKTNVKFASGSISFKARIGNQQSDFSRYVYPSIQGNAFQFLNFCNTSTVSSGGYLVMDNISTNYQELIGAQAFKDWCTFMESKQSNIAGDYAPWKLVDATLDDSPLRNSVTTYAFSSALIGQGQGIGAWSSMISLEVFPREPKFAVFCLNAPNRRGFRGYHAMGGDSNYLVGSILNQAYTKEYKSKNYPVMKCVDFFEVAQRYLMLLQTVMTRAKADAQVKTPDAIPMTLNDFLVLLRCALMENFSGSQYQIQSIWDKIGQTDMFIPYLCGSNTAPRGSSIQFPGPLLFVENMKSLRGRRVYSNVIPGKDKLDLHSPRYYLPILGQYKTAPVWTTDDWQYTNGEGDAPMFTGTGDPVSLVDGSLNGTWLNVANSPVIQTNAAAFSKFWDSIKSYIEKPAILTPEPGINAFELITMTALVDEYVDNNKVVPQKKKEKCDSDEDMEIVIKKKPKKRSPMVSIEKKGLMAVTSQQPFLESMWQIQSMCVLPEMTVHITSSDTGSINHDTLRVVNVEPNTIFVSAVTGQNASPTSLVNYSSLRSKYVSAMVKSFNAEDSELTSNLMKLSDQGRGNLFNSIAKAFTTVEPLIPLASSAIRMMLG